MKLITIQSISAGLILGVVSCTFPKKDCVEASADMINTIIFNNFTQQDVDSIILNCYNVSSDFTTPIDSSVIHGIQFDTLKYFAETGFIKLNLDYKIIMVKTGQIFKITGFTTKRAICSKSLFNTSYFNQLESYYINGQKKTGNAIEIYKE
jgi:hypothetical protein